MVFGKSNQVVVGRNGLEEYREGGSCVNCATPIENESSAKGVFIGHVVVDGRYAIFEVGKIWTIPRSARFRWAFQQFQLLYPSGYTLDRALRC